MSRLYPNTTNVNALESIDVQYFIEYFPEKNLQVISVRGTDNFANAKEDADYIESKNEKLAIYVHRGFDNDTSQVYADLLPHLRANVKVSLTGHSLGAAISTLLMMYLHLDGFEIEQSINFGQPKVTNKKGVAEYRFLPLTRVVDEDDVVPLVPPVTLLDSIHGVYEHFGVEVILLEGENYHYLKEHDAERKSVGSFWRNIGHESVTDHFIANYIKHIKDKTEHATEIPIS